MRARSAKALGYALLLSLLIHLILLFGTHFELPNWKPVPPLTVAIETPPAPAPVVETPPPPPPPSKPRKATPPPVVPVTTLPEDIETNPAPTLEPVTDTPATPEPAPRPPEPVPTVAPPPITTRQAFPAQVEVVYSVYRGDQGLKLGTTTHQWHVSGTQYLLTSTTKASGLISLFYSGRYTMTSKGNITPDGLQPVSFWIQRGQSNDHTEIAEFNWQFNTLDYGNATDRHTIHIEKGTQDQLSAFYQLALAAPHQSGLRIALTTGRKFNQYTYQFVGDEILDTPIGKLKTQHLARVTTKIDASDSTDIWLAITQHYLPVRFRLGTRDGAVLDHWINELRVDGKSIAAKAEEAAQ